jgi:hypothetical protein
MSPTHIEQMLAETSRAEDIVIDGEQIWLMRQASNMPGDEEAEESVAHALMRMWWSPSSPRRLIPVRKP